jgi:hypothetical protein
MSEIRDVNDLSSFIQNISFNMGSVQAVGSNIDHVITVANDLNEAISEVETVANDLNETVSEIETVANSATNIDIVGNDINNINSVANNMDDIITVSNIATEIDTIVNDAELVSDIKTAQENAVSAASSLSETLAVQQDIQNNYATYTSGATYSKDNLDTKFNSIDHFSGYTQYVPKKDNFVFEESTAFVGKIGDKNRYLDFNGDRVDTYGEELVTNGDFSDGTTGWTFGTGWSISGGVAGHDGLTQYNKIKVTEQNLVVGTTYRLKFEVTKNSGTLYLTLGFATESFTTGKYDIIRTASGTQFAFQSNYFNGIVENISVREIQTADLSDKIPDVTVQDQATNGLTVQSAVSAGDYVVVDREELVTNGAFDSDLSGWSDSGNSTSIYDSGTIKVTTTANEAGVYQTGLGIIEGVDYVLKYTVSNLTDATRTKVFLGTSIGNPNISESNDKTGNGEYTIVFKAKTSSSNAILHLRVVDTGSANFDNISIKQVDESYRATRDTADMYDYECIAGTPFDIVYGKIYKMSNFNASDMNGAYFKRVGTSASGITYPQTFDIAPDGDASWEYLGTASNMSLENPYFENRDNEGIYNQVAVLHKYNPTTKTYLGMDSEILFYEMLAIETPKGFMTKNGFSVVSEGVYSKGDYWYIVSGVWNSLNKGAYHPDFNAYGTAGGRGQGADLLTSGTSYQWFNTTALDGEWQSTAQTFVFADADFDAPYYPMASETGSVSSTQYYDYRPDSKFYDIIYKDQFIDMREYSFNFTEQQMKDRKKELKLEQISGDVVTCELTQTSISGKGGSGYYFINLESGLSVTEALLTEYTCQVFNKTTGKMYYLRYSNASFPTRVYLYSSNSFAFNTYDATETATTWAEQTVGDEIVIILIKQNNHLSQGTRLHNRLYGDPASYPSTIKNRLSEGKPIIAEPVLVSDD